MSREEKLFTEFQVLSGHIKNLSAIVQNSGVSISVGKLKEWSAQYDSVINRLQSLHNETVAHVVKNCLK